MFCESKHYRPSAILMRQGDYLALRCIRELVTHRDWHGSACGAQASAAMRSPDPGLVKAWVFQIGQSVSVLDAVSAISAQEATRLQHRRRTHND